MFDFAHLQDPSRFSATIKLPARRSRPVMLALSCASLLLTGCVTVPLTHPVETNLIEHQIDKIDDYSPIEAFRDPDGNHPRGPMQKSSRTLMARGQANSSVRSVAYQREPASSAKAPADSRWWNGSAPQGETGGDSPDWPAIVRAIGPSGKSAMQQTANLAGRTYARGRGWVSGAARYAGTKIGYGQPQPSGEYMVTARPGQVGRGGLCWPTIGKVSRGFDPGINHKGIDICAPTGTPVIAARGGKVVYSGKKLSGFGNVVILDHGAGFASVYAHNSKNLVQDGAYVRQGQQIALVGQTGEATTPHCHFEMRYNTQPIDPRPFLP